MFVAFYAFYALFCHIQGPSLKMLWRGHAFPATDCLPRRMRLLPLYGKTQGSSAG